jgi:HemY protein
MADRTDTKLLGLHGLFIEAQRRNDAAAARGFAEQAAKAEPALPWAGEAALHYRCLEGDWNGALAALESNMRNGLVARDVYKRQRAVLLTGRALSGEVDRDAATSLALEALKLCPGLVPAAALAGRLLADGGKPRRASRIVEQAWEINPHPDLAEVYAGFRPRQSARDRLRRIRALARLMPNHPESALAVARAALDAQEFRIARDSLGPLLDNPTQRVAALMAELEERGNGDIGRAREWMARALNAQRDPAWTADGIVSSTWMPVSPATGRLDAFEWRIPVADLGPHGPMIDHDRQRALQSPHAAPDHAEPTDSAAAAGESEPGEPPAPQDRTARAPGHTVVHSPSIAMAGGAASAAAGAGPAARERPAKPDGGAAPVIPLVHAPDDPGPEPSTDSDGGKDRPWYYRR